MSLLKLLTNDMGAAAVTLDWGNARNVIATGYNLTDMITGPRSKKIRSAQGSGSSIGIFYPRYSCDPASVPVNYAVIARADYLTRRTNGCQIYFTGYGATANGSYLEESVVSNATLSAGLIGPKSQDYVFKYPAQRTRFGASVQSYTSTVTGVNVGQCGQIYFSTGFDFGASPDTKPEPQWDDVPDEDRLFTPLRGHFPYETEKKITLSWKNITTAKLTAFKALPHILNWPLFLYDEDADIWDWKLEHVLVESWAEQIAAPGYWDIDITFRRLAHYD